MPLHTDLFLYKSVYHQRLSRRFLPLDKTWCINMQPALVISKDDIFPQGAPNTGGSQQAAHSPEWAPFWPNLNLGENRTALNYITLSCGILLKSYAPLHFNIISLQLHCSNFVSLNKKFGSKLIFESELNNFPNFNTWKISSHISLIKNGTILLKYIRHCQFLFQQLVINFVLIKVCSFFLSIS